MLNSLNEPTRCLIHSRATKIGQRMWKRKELCSKGVPWRSRIRKRISPSSDSSISSFFRANETRAPFTTERSLAITPSSLTKPWSRTRIVFSGITLVVAATGTPSVARVPVGALQPAGHFDNGALTALAAVDHGGRGDRPNALREPEIAERGHLERRSGVVQLVVRHAGRAVEP